MKEKMRAMKLIRYTIILCALTIFGTVGVAAQTDCSTQSNQDFVLSIYQAIQKKYPAAVRNLNITADGGAITIVGWYASKKEQGKILSIIKKVKCVTTVTNRATIGKTGGCGPGQRECGGTCIGEKDVCNVCLIDPAAPGCATEQTQKKPNE